MDRTTNKRAICTRKHDQWMEEQTRGPYAQESMTNGWKNKQEGHDCPFMFTRVMTALLCSPEYHSTLENLTQK